MIRGGATAGFTIVEIMIFLAISGVLIVGALTTIGGRQGDVEFQQGTRDVQSKIDDVINQVASGFYPHNDSVVCTVAGAGAPALSSGSRTQGSNESCVFLGKVVQFAPDTSSGDYNVISVAARRLAASGQDASSLAESYPTAVANGGIDITEKFTLPYGLKVISVKTGPTAGGSVAFFGTFPKKAGGGNLASGAQHVSVAMVPGSRVGEGIGGATSSINNLHSQLDTILNPAAGIVVCLSNEAGTRKAQLTIGGTADNQTTTKLETVAVAAC